MLWARGIVGLGKGGCLASLSLDRASPTVVGVDAHGGSQTLASVHKNVKTRKGVALLVVQQLLPNSPVNKQQLDNGA